MPTVTNPTAGNVHVNTPLTNFGQKYLQSDDVFVSLRAMPNLPVAKQSDTYYEFDKGDFWRTQNTKRADGAESGGGGFTTSTSPYFCDVYAWHKDITERQEANADPQITLQQSAVQYVNQILMIDREIKFADTFMSSANWTSSLNTHWVAANGDPTTEVKTAKRTIQGLTGKRPNKMIFGRQAWDTLTENDSILSRITGGANNAMPAMVMRTLIAQLFEIDEIFIMDAVKNTAIEGASDSLSFIGGDDALLYYAPNVVTGQEPTAGLQFSWTGLLGNTPNGMRIKRIDAPLREAERIEGQMAYDYKVTAPDLGYMFLTVSAG